MDENTIMADLVLPFPKGYAYVYANDGDRYGFGIPKYLRLGSNSWDIDCSGTDHGKVMDKDIEHKGNMLVKAPIPLDVFVKILRNYTTNKDGEYDTSFDDLKEDMDNYQERCDFLFTELEKEILGKAYDCTSQEEFDSFVKTL